MKNKRVDWFQWVKRLKQQEQNKETRMEKAFRRARKHSENLMDAAKDRQEFKSDHPLAKTLGAKSKIGDFGEAFFYEYFGCGKRTNSEHDCIHKDWGKVEIKTAKDEGKPWFNQIRFEKDWDALVFISVTNKTIEIWKTDKSKEDDLIGFLTINNGYSFKGEMKEVRESGLFEMILKEEY